MGRRLATLVLALVPAVAVGREPQPGGVTVSGRVTLGVIRPSGDAVWVTPGGECPQFIPDDRVVSRPDGSLRDSVVMLFPLVSGKPKLEPAAPAEAEVRALRCGLEPRVQVARPGSLLVFTTEPGAAHLLHAYRDGNTLWEELRDGRRTRVLTAPGSVDLRCDRGHEWELAWVYVTDAPWVTVTDEAGRFTLPDVPRGEYRLRVWHPYLGSLAVPIEVEPERPSGLVVSFAGRGRVDALYPGDWVEVP